jgi:hypothetical protein
MRAVALDKSTTLPDGPQGRAGIKTSIAALMEPDSTRPVRPLQSASVFPDPRRTVRFGRYRCRWHNGCAN